MRAFLVILSLLLSMPGAGSETLDGPFGFTAGQTVSSDPSCKQSGQSFWFKCRNPPRPHKDIVEYSVLEVPGFGACSVLVNTTTVGSDAYGMELRRVADELADQIETAYGKPRKKDLLRSGSIWGEPRDWLIGLIKRERLYEYHWAGKMRNRVTAISLEALAYAPGGGVIVMVFDFENAAACRDAIRKEKGKAF